MPFKYMGLGLPGYPLAPKDQLKDGFQALLNDQFYNSTTIQTIQEEHIVGSNAFSEIDVRINRAINSMTGEKLGDDFKIILFNDLSHDVGIGKKYYFSNNYWITVFSEVIMNLGVSCMVRRCNEVLRWMVDGVYYEEPCAMEYKIARPRDTTGAGAPVVPAGFFDLYAQFNDRTKTIRDNQRFLFGTSDYRTAFKVFGRGVQNSLRQETSNDSSVRLLILSVGGNYVNQDTDDIELGIADRYENFGKFTSGSTSGSLSIVAYPNSSKIFEGESKDYSVNYYSGSVVQSGSFVFSINDVNVPTDRYDFSTLTGNSFRIVNNQRYLENTLNVLCSGSSGSRILNIELRGDW